jgi:hypothetical protein
MEADNESICSSVLRACIACETSFGFEAACPIDTQNTIRAAETAAVPMVFIDPLLFRFRTLGEFFYWERRPGPALGIYPRNSVSWLARAVQVYRP